MSKRGIAATLFAKPVESFDLINYSCRFASEKKLFNSSPLLESRYDLHDLVAQDLSGTTIDYLEFGVWTGDTFKRWLNMNGSPESRFWGFDSFEGLPENWDKFPKGTFSVNGHMPETSDERATFVKGWFQDTLYPFLDTYRPSTQQVIHIDCDLYSSTLFVLSALDRYLLPGAILIFDDFSSLCHEFAAWLDYKRSFNRSFEPIALVKHGLQAAFRLDR